MFSKLFNTSTSQLPRKVLLNGSTPNAFSKVSLRVVLIVPFVLQVFAAVGLVGWLSFRSGQQAVNDVASQLRSEITNRIQERLSLYIEVPHLLNRLNAKAIAFGQWNLQNTPNLDNYFWLQLQAFEGIGSNYLGNPNGEFAGAERRIDGTLTIYKANASTNGDLFTYKTDNKGNTTKLDTISPKYDPRLRPWYTTAVKTGKPIWSEIYADFTTKSIAITAAQPIYDQRGQLLGVLGSDLIFVQVNQFLQSLKIGKTGNAFIMERSGNLVTTSTTAPVQIVQLDSTKRIKATQSQNELIRHTATYLEQHFGSLAQIHSSQQLSFEIDGAKQFFQVTPLRDGRGLDWLIVVVVPEADFMEQIHTNTHTTILLCLAALVVATVSGILTAHWIAQPIFRLNEASKAIATGNLDQKLEVKGINELETLAGSFNSMADQLKDSFAALEAKHTDLAQAKEALAEAKEQLEAVLNAVPGLISWVSSKGRYLGVNRHLAESLNLTPDTIIGKELGFFNNSPEYAKFIRQFLASTEEAASQEIPVAVHGSVRYYLMAVQKYQQGSATVSVGIDISERRHAEAALRIAEENYRSIFENALEGIFQSTPDGHYINVNPAMARIHGYDSPTEMIATVTPLSYQLYVDLSYRDEFRHRMEEIGEVNGFEYQVYRKDSSIIWVEENTRAVRDSNGQLLYYEGIIQDITKRKQNEQNLNRQLQELRIEIDQQTRKQEVAKITQSDYFQELQAEIAELNADEFWS